MKPAIYGHADVGRYGLGHSLLAWARCVVWCHQTGAKMLAPRWLRLRVGPYLRRERDKRNYFLLFSGSGYVGGVARIWHLTRNRQISAESPDAAPVLAAPPPGTVVVFRNAMADNEKKHFSEVYGHAALLHRELLRITRPAHRPVKPVQPFIAVHVRMGDFAAPSEVGGIRPGVHNVRLPVEWYAQMLVAVRQGLGADVPALVFSDGDDAALAPLLVLTSTQRPPQRPSITDMLTIAQAGLLISSGSGFSLWGAFLGEVPRICYPGQSVVPAHLNPAMETECVSADELTLDFVDSLRSRLAGGC
jgi:hypothetical protein